MSTQGWVLLFIVVIFGMIAGLIVIYQRAKRNTAGVLKEGDKGFERESRLFALYQNLEDMMDGFDSYVEETRAALEMEKIEFLREREEITRMHGRIQALLHRIENDALTIASARQEAPPPAPEAPAPPPAAPEPKVQPAGARAQAIWALHCQGRSAEEIARELGIAQNEINLTLRVLT